MMRSTPKITRVQLKVNQNIEPVIVGIVSPEPDYKLSLTLNKRLKVSLKHSKPLIIPGLKNNEILFSRFSDNSSPHGMTIDLISNHNEKETLIKKLKNIDFFFRIHYAENLSDTSEMITEIKKIESVTAVFNIEIGSLKDKNANYIIQ